MRFEYFFTICQEKSCFIKIGQRKKSTLREDHYTFLIICLSVLLRMRNVSLYSCIENQNTYFMFKNLFQKIVPFMIMWKKYCKPGGPQMKIWRMHIACWVRKTTSTHSKYIQYLLLSRCVNSCTKRPQCYIMRTLPSCFAFQQLKMPKFFFKFLVSKVTHKTDGL